MKVYSLTGKAGTGKSYQAISLCARKNIDGIIDDGLFIYRGKVVKGISAKKQKTRVGAIKTALFTDPNHCETVKNAIKTQKPRSLVILGTSDEMADRIAARLDIPKAVERIYIEDITTEEERGIAGRERIEEGKHIIPVPTPQLKRDFAGYFLDPMRFLRERSFSGGKVLSPGERTVVRPTFSYMGDFYISDTVFTDIAECVAVEMGGRVRIIGVYENTSPENMIMKVIIAIESGLNLWEEAAEFQDRMQEMVEFTTAYNLVRLEVEVRNVV